MAANSNLALILGHPLVLVSDLTPYALDHVNFLRIEFMTVVHNTNHKQLISRQLLRFDTIYNILD